MSDTARQGRHMTRAREIAREAAVQYIGTRVWDPLRGRSQRGESHSRSRAHSRRTG